MRVPVTVAVDLRGEYTEEETGRKLDALEWLGHRYARIEKTGRIELTSFEREAVDLEITCRLGGHADKVSHDGRIAVGAYEAADWLNYIGHPAVNNHSVVDFTLRVEPGETATLEVRYHYFTRH